MSVEFRVWNEVTVKIWIEGESGIIKAVTGFCGSSDAYYTCRTVPVSSKFHVGLDNNQNVALNILLEMEETDKMISLLFPRCDCALNFK